MLLLIFATVTLCITLGLVCYLRLPDAGLCPRCGTRVHRAAAVPGGGRGFGPLRRLTVVGRCPACAWEGRMRCGAEPGAVPLDRGGEREDS